MLSNFCFIACSSSRNAAYILGKIRCPSATLLTIDGLTFNMVCDPRKEDTTPTPVKTEAAKRGLTNSTLSSVIAFGEDFFTRSTSCSIAHTALMRYPL